MDSDVVADLKKFISSQMSEQLSDVREDMKLFVSAELRQQTVQFKDEMRAEMSQQIAGLEKKLDTKIEGTKNEILDAIGEVTNSQNTLIDDHEVRITKLGQRAA